MGAPFRVVLRMLLTALGVLGGIDFALLGDAPSALALGIVVMAAALVVLVVVSAGSAGLAGVVPVRPRRAIGMSVLPSQSDPDAPGHPRPRAPQSVAPAT